MINIKGSGALVVLSWLGASAMAANMPVSGGIVDYPIAGPKSASPQAIAHYNAARAIVTKDPSMLGIFHSQCNAGKAKADYLDADRKFEHANPPQPEKIFDNLYFIPVPYVSSYAIATSDGIILIDTLDNENEVKSVMIPALKKFGLEPKDIKYAIVTHEHADHFGGAKYLQDTYHTRIYASAKAWDAMAKLKDAKAPPPSRDLVATDGMKLTLGGETVTTYLTPGHTVGTLSVLIPVTDHGTPHLVSDWGGTSVHNELLPAYISSLQRFRAIALKAGADVVISEHQHVMTRPLGGFTSASGKSPLVIGTDGVKRYTDVHLECLQWNAARVANGDPD